MALAALLIILSGCEEPLAGGGDPRDDPGGSGLSFTGGVVDRAYVVGVPVGGLVLPAVSGASGGVTYSLAPSVPGLSFDAGTRTLSGTPSVVDAYELTYKATDSAGRHASLSFVLAVGYAVGADEEEDLSDVPLAPVLRAPVGK